MKKHVFCAVALLTVPLFLSSCVTFQEGDPGKSLVGSESRTAEGIASAAEMENQFAASVQMLWIRNGTFGRMHSARAVGSTPSVRFRRMLKDAGLSLAETKQPEYLLQDSMKDGIRTISLAGPDGAVVLKNQCRILSPAERDNRK